MKKMIAFIVIMVVGLILVVLYASKNAEAYALDVTERTNVTIAKLSITDTEGVTPGKITQGSYYNLVMDWDASSYGDQLKEGDYFDITLPDEFRFPTNHSACNFDILTPEGDVVAKAIVDSNGADGGGNLRIVFTNYVEGRKDIKGTAQLSFTIITTKVQFNEQNTIAVTVGSAVYPLSIFVEGSAPKPLNPDEALSKWSSRSNSTDTTAVWSSRINFARKTLKNAYITDSLTTGDGVGPATYIPDSFILYERVMDEYGEGAVLNKWDADELGSRLVFSEDMTSFTLSLGDVQGTQYQLVYASTFSPGMTLQNRMELTAEDDKWVSVAVHEMPGSGGTGSGIASDNNDNNGVTENGINEREETNTSNNATKTDQNTKNSIRQAPKTVNAPHTGDDESLPFNMTILLALVLSLCLLLIKKAL